MKAAPCEDLETGVVLDFLESKQAGGEKLYLIIWKRPHSWPRGLPGWPEEHIEDSWPQGRDFGILAWASIWDLGIHYWGIYLGGRH